MTKLADILGQKEHETDAARIVPLPTTATVKGKRSDSDLALPPSGGGGERMGSAAESFLAATRGGDNNDALHHLVVNTRRKIDELDEIKQAFDLMVVPFSTAIRELEQERLLSKSLAGQLSEKTSVYEKTYSELQATKKKLGQAEADVESLRGSLAHAHEAARVLENAQAQLNDEVNRRGGQIAELERQLDQESTQRQSLAESCRTLKDQVARAEKRIGELQGNLSAAQQKCATLDDEKRGLRNSLDQSLTEAATLNRRLEDSESGAATLRDKLGKLETRHTEISSERDSLAATLHEVSEQRQIEKRMLNERIEALQSRANAADRLAVEMRQRLIARTEEARAFITKTAEATLARGTAERRLAEIEILQGRQEREESDRSRTALNEFLDALSTNELAPNSAAEKLAALNDLTSETSGRVMPSGPEQRRVEKSALDSERLLADLEVALDTPRKPAEPFDNAIGELRAVAARGHDKPVPPAKAAAATEAERAREQEEAKIAHEREEARVAREIEAYVPRKTPARSGATPQDALFAARQRRPSEVDEVGRNILNRIVG